MRIFPTSTLLFQPVRLFIWAIISILDQISKLNRKLTNKIGIIRQYFGSIFPTVRLFQPVRLLVLTNFPTSTFIRDFRVVSLTNPIIFLKLLTDSLHESRSLDLKRVAHSQNGVKLHTSFCLVNTVCNYWIKSWPLIQVDLY